MSDPAGWTSSTERGSLVLLRFGAWLVTLLGRRGRAVLLAPIVAYFFVTSGGARRASQLYLRRLFSTAAGRAALGRPPRAWDSFHHLWSFAELMADRIRFWADRAEEFEVCFPERDELMELVQKGRGAVLVGAHLGSFDVLRALAAAQNIKVNVLMYTENAQRINSVVRALDPSSEVRVIQIDPTSVRTAFAVKACLERGEFVAILGDRLGFDGRGRLCETSFLGAPASFPQGPFLMSLLLEAPIFLVVALKTGALRYEIFSERIAPGVPVPIPERAKEIQKRVETYAELLEHYCARAPYQWFNFYDFWSGQGGSSSDGQTSDAGPAGS